MAETIRDQLEELKADLRTNFNYVQERDQVIKANFNEMLPQSSLNFLLEKRKEYVIKEPFPNEPGTNAFRDNKHKFKKHMDDILDVGCLVLATMTPELQKQNEYMVAYEMIQNLKEIFKGKHDCRAAFTLNRVPSESFQKTPHEMWIGKRPNMSFMKVWGGKAYVKHQMSTKISLEKGKCRNIEQKEVQQQQVHEQEVGETPQVVEDNSTDLETQPLRRTTREHHEPERCGFLVTTHGDVILLDQDKPNTYQEAVSSPDSEKWLEPMRSEMDSMSENQVWSLVEPPEGIKPIDCKWVFKKKTDMDGNVQTYKGRLVSKGFRQIHGVDYDETFSPVVMLKSIRILLFVAAFHDYEFWQMNVKTAFLKWKTKRGCVHDTTRRFCDSRECRNGL
ncbi:hypothetical protein V6N11_051121 [Hibiscus sabdariffa]|uniref:Reverse transcriptase Ty1/copia-type domain-containing protein n=1 Tax=Hibiscus sabdariffa TaxID=183260 RepID=A0ABR2R2W4_9ROSI